MYARINEITWKDDQSEAEFVRWRDLIRAQPGFRGYLILDKGNHQEVAITLWETREAHHAWAGHATFRQFLHDDTESSIATWSAAEAIVARAELPDTATLPQEGGIAMSKG
jgi:heme-degrading monooxygenase HmoA